MIDLSGTNLDNYGFCIFSKACCFMRSNGALWKMQNAALEAAISLVYDTMNCPEGNYSSMCEKQQQLYRLYITTQEEHVSTKAMQSVWR